jgi:hypothetical protein
MRLGQVWRASVLILLLAVCTPLVASCGGSGEDAAAIRQAIREAYEAKRGYAPAKSTIAALMDPVREAKKTLSDAVANVPEDERDSYKKAMCAALKTIANNGEPDWEDLVGTFGLSSPAYEFRQATENLQARAEEGAPLPNLALWSFIDYACV